MERLTVSKIEKMIYMIRGHKVMLDADLAELYGIETKKLNQQVRRNLDRFPEDFMFQLLFQEFIGLKSQFVTSKTGRGGKHKLPLVFTENGVAMLSSVLNTPQAVQINIEIMRIFTRLRSFLLLEHELNRKVEKLEDGTKKMFKIVFERLDQIEEDIQPALPGKRKKIGLQKD